MINKLQSFYKKINITIYRLSLRKLDNLTSILTKNYWNRFKNRTKKDMSQLILTH